MISFEITPCLLLAGPLLRGLSISRKHMAQPSIQVFCFIRCFRGCSLDTSLKGSRLAGWLSQSSSGAVLPPLMCYPVRVYFIKVVSCNTNG